MNSIFNEEALFQLGEDNKHKYQYNTPFPHIVIDNFMDSLILERVLEKFPAPNEMNFYQYDNPLEKKLAFDQIAKLPSPISDTLVGMNSPAFLKFLEILTGIDGLIGDPYYRGGGIHQIERGGKLDIHIDFNKHKKLNLDRRLNAIIYLNKEWREEYNGHLELWEGEKQGEIHTLKSLKNRILPIFNRFVCFSTSEYSYHGHPEVLCCPEGWSRKSLATYYYTNGRDDGQSVDAHSTTFIKRPSDEDSKDLEELRKRRNEGRISTNIKANVTT